MASDAGQTEIIDFEAKGNTVRFHLGKNGAQWGDDWNDAPYEHNAGCVYEQFRMGTCDVHFPFDWEVQEPCYGELNSRWTKEDMRERRVPCIVAVPPGPQEWNDYRFGDLLARDDARIRRYYFGDTLRRGTLVIHDDTEVCE